LVAPQPRRANRLLTLEEANNACFVVKGPQRASARAGVDVWTLPAAIFFCTMGMFAGAAALYLTGTRVRLLGHQAAEIVLFGLLFAIAVFVVIAAAYP
jgi:hypothetical protein